MVRLFFWSSIAFGVTVMVVSIVMIIGFLLGG
jgi:hypothetical protein